MSDIESLKRQLKESAATIKKLESLVKEAYLEGFNEGSDGGWLSNFGDGQPWQERDTKKALQAMKESTHAGN